MEEIVKTLLLEGIDEAIIHKVLDVIEEEYEIASEDLKSQVWKKYNAKMKASDDPKEKNQLLNRAVELSDKAHELKHKAEATLKPFHKEAHKQTKNTMGKIKTDERRKGES